MTCRASRLRLADGRLARFYELRTNAALDERSAWVEDGTPRSSGKDDPTPRIIDPQTFVRNGTALARYVGRE